jgi:hypothetical protein
LSESTVDFSFLFLSLSTLYRFQGPAPLMATVDSLTYRISFVNTFFRFFHLKISMIFDGNFSLSFSRDRLYPCSVARLGMAFSSILLRSIKVSRLRARPGLS